MAEFEQRLASKNYLIGNQLESFDVLPAILSHWLAFNVILCHSMSISVTQTPEKFGSDRDFRRGKVCKVDISGQVFGIIMIFTGSAIIKVQGM